MARVVRRSACPQQRAVRLRRGPPTRHRSRRGTGSSAEPRGAGAGLRAEPLHRRRRSGDTARGHRESRPALRLRTPSGHHTGWRSGRYRPSRGLPPGGGRGRHHRLRTHRGRRGSGQSRCAGPLLGAPPAFTSARTVTVGAGAYGLARVATDHLLYASKDLIEGDWVTHLRMHGRPRAGCRQLRDPRVPEDISVVDSTATPSSPTSLLP
jgi:hypothetical protein